LLDPGLPAFLRAWRAGELSGSSDGEPLPPPNPELFGAYVDDLLAIDPRALGRRPPDLAALLTDLALGSPAILAARSLSGGASVGDDARRRLGALIAEAFWRLFNRPAVIALLRQLAPATAGAARAAPRRARLHDSVAPDVNTIRCGYAPTSPATRIRAVSTASAAARP
jgi:hypothetical protein